MTLIIACLGLVSTMVIGSVVWRKQGPVKAIPVILAAVIFFAAIGVLLITLLLRDMN